MRIDNVEFSSDLNEILNELLSELRANGLPYINKMVETSTHIQVCCPFHNNGLERRPSAGIRKSDGLFHCFACGEVHSLAEVVSRCFEKDDTGFFGWNWLLKNFASVEVQDRKPLTLDLGRQTNMSVDAPKYVSEEELDKYRYNHPYWAKRKITNEQLIELFDLGYDPETDCITMPNRDLNGNCVFVARRSVKTKHFNYPKGVKKPVYGLYEIKRVIEGRDELNLIWEDNLGIPHTIPKKKLVFDDFNFNEVIICESMIDALTCWEYGKFAVALNGLGTPEQFEQLREFPCRRYIIATDMDEYGIKARKRIKKSLYNKIVTEYFWDLSIAKDINDMEKPYFMGLEEYF